MIRQSNRPAGRARSRRLVLLAAPTLLAGLVTTTSISGAAASPAHPPVPVTSHNLGLSGAGFSQPGPASADVQLITGQRLRVVRSVTDQYTATQLGSEPGQPPLVVQAARATNGHTTLSAVPNYARPLVAQGKVDPSLFELTSLAGHDNGTTVPVVVHYNAVRTVAATARAADALPGSAYVAGTATTQQATVAVALDNAATFWSAVTRLAAFDPNTPAGRVWAHNPSAPRQLVPGVSALTLAGAPAVQTRPASTVPTYRFTIVVKGFSDRSRWVNLNHAADYGFSYALGVTGPNTGLAVYPNTATCDDEACLSISVSFDLPAGVYQFGSQFYAWRNSRFAHVLIYRPQVNLTRDLRIGVRMDDAGYTAMSTTRPSEAASYSSNTVRVLPDGTQYSDLIGLSLINQDYDSGAWVLPTPATTIGASRFQVNDINEQPLVSMATGGVRLTPQYGYGVGSIDALPSRTGQPTYKFPNGTRSYTVLDAGAGTPEDFAKQNFTGKVAIIRAPQVDPGTCRARETELDAAVAAHAAGVIYDPTILTTINHSCVVPLVPYWFLDPSASVPPIPWVTVQPAEAVALERKVHDGATTVTVTNNDKPGYIYSANRSWESSIPADLTTRFAASTTTTRTLSMHQTVDGQQIPNATIVGWRGNDNLSYGPYYGLWTPNALPAALTEYLGPLSTDSVVQQSWQTCRTCGGPGVDATDWNQSQVDLLDGSTKSVAFGQQPFSLGPPTQAARLSQVSLAGQFLCALCRQGELLFPFLTENSGAAPSASLSNSTGDLAIYDATLTANGVPIENGGIAFTVPAAAKNYVLKSSSPSQDVTWKFRSAEVDHRTAPPGALCVGEIIGATDPCDAPPIVFLRFATDVDNTNHQAPGVHTLHIQAYEQAVSAPAITALTSQVSFDGGTTWTILRATRTANGKYDVTFTVPPTARTNGYVTLRTTARDADGNSIDQTLYNSYRIG